MCINCFKAEVDAKCNAATLAELELALAALPAQAAQFLQVQFGVALAGCADLEPGVSAQKKQTNRQRAARTIATDWIGQKARAHLRGRLAEVGIGERSMAAGVAPADRDLDRVCRMLMTPLRDHVCIAACWSPAWWPLETPAVLISSNTSQGNIGEYDGDTAGRIGEFFRGQAALDNGQAAAGDAQMKQAHAARARGRPGPDMAAFLDRRDRLKLKGRVDPGLLEALKTGNVVVVNTAGKDVHAELRLLEYLEWVSDELADKDRHRDAAVYIGVSLLCCAKCLIFLDRCRHCAATLFRPATRGHHGFMDANWAAPPLLNARLNEQDLVDRIVQSRAGLHDIAAPATHHMTQDLSDSDPDE